MGKGRGEKYPAFGPPLTPYPLTPPYPLLPLAFQWEGGLRGVRGLQQGYGVREQTTVEAGKTRQGQGVKQEIECTYKQLFDINIYKSSYQLLKSNPGKMTKGTDNETLDGFSLE